ncbi:MAG TPA: hypothetical protein H9770_00250 [Candidatus Fournierella excrementigallinarum]|nr:hypothetical protein [Candidatus Fournierella excrementigallinarum]
MTRCFRFLLRFSLINLAVFAAAAAVIVGGAFVTDVPSGNTNLFSTYFDGFPALSLFILFMMAFSMTSTLTLALNFGATRKALFVALQGVLAIYAVGGWAISALFSALPVWCGWPREGAATALMLNTSPAFLTAGAAAAVLGLLSGVMLARSRLLGGLLIVLAVLLMLAGTFWLVITGGAFSGEGWGSLPWLLPLALGLAAVAADAFLYRYLKGYVVR